MNPRSLLLSSAERLREAGVPDPVNDAALLLSSLCGKPPLALRLDAETELPASLRDDYERLLKRRLSREPLQYILGETVFCSLPFHTDRRALIPRPETELLCLWAGEKITTAPVASLLDLCCGSGCIGLALKRRFPSLDVTLADLSPEALSLAEENAAALGLSVHLSRGDLFGAVAGRVFDLIVSNPPYIPSETCRGLQEEVRREPVLALDGGEDGLDFYRRIIGGAPRHLSGSGGLLLELGADEAAAVSDLLHRARWRDVALRQDDRGIDRMIFARCPEGRTHG